MLTQVKLILYRLQKPSVILSIASQIISILIIFGVQVNGSLVMTAVAAMCSVLVTLGILSNPDTLKKTYGDDLLVCSSSGTPEPHVEINGQMICATCGAVHTLDPTAPPGEQ